MGVVSPIFFGVTMKNNAGKLVPVHIAVIMDGNGRWAKSRGLSRPQGHLEGVKRVDEIVLEASRLGVKVLTLYTFSTENWSRPEAEVNMLMRTLIMALESKLRKLHDNGVVFRHCGRRQGVPSAVLAVFDRAMQQTAGNKGLVLNVAFNYGSRQEIVDTVRSLSLDCVAGKLVPDEITEDLFSSRLYTGGLPDPDLLIRTSGEIRISNFLLWQLSYAEFYFVDKFWPDFDAAELNKAVAEFQRRSRRFGAVAETGSEDSR